ncbi:MAG: hypothetical protein Q9202_003444 [Teloschistes flavicans]
MDSKDTMVALPNRPQSQSSSDKASTDKRRPVRRDPEKRRQQNIQAQKKYREKLKKRLDHLEHLETLAASVAEVGRRVIPGATPATCPSTAPTSQLFPFNSTTTEHESSCPHRGRNSNDRSDASSVDFSDLGLSASIPSASSSDITLWDPTTPIDPSHLIPDMDDLASTSHQYWFSYVDCGCFRPHVQISSAGPRQYRDVKVLNPEPNPFPADLYANALRVERVCIVQAILSNCLHIGITEDMFCDDDAISPFYRPSGDTVDDSGSDRVVKTIQGIFKTLKQDVRPIREQITTMHSPVIDVLPFPTLRKNLIKSGSAVDEDELYDDLLNGLVCWGGAGVGRRDRDCSTGNISTGTPWDSRSWEARTWFLQKYWALLGGEEGELVRQSEWWRNMRGDEADPWSWQ